MDEKRNEAVCALKKSIAVGVFEDSGWKEPLWNCVVLFQDYKFMTVGRGKKHFGATGFTYKLKISSRTGKINDEIVLQGRGERPSQRAAWRRRFVLRLK